MLNSNNIMVRPVASDAMGEVISASIHLAVTTHTSRGAADLDRQMLIRTLWNEIYGGDLHVEMQVAKDLIRRCPPCPQVVAVYEQLCEIDRLLREPPDADPLAAAAKRAAFHERMIQAGYWPR